jgi:hypothetical protein
VTPSQHFLFYGCQKSSVTHPKDFWGKSVPKWDSFPEIAVFRQYVPAGHQNAAGFFKFSNFPL